MSCHGYTIYMWLWGSLKEQKYQCHFELFPRSFSWLLGMSRPQYSLKVYNGIMIKLIRSLSLSLFIFSMLGWFFVAAKVWTSSKELGQPTHLTFWIREDTFGFICFLISFFSFFVWTFIKSPINNNRIMLEILRSLSLSLFIFGFLGWVYIVGNSFGHPKTLSQPLSHLVLWIREDTFGIVCFLVSFLAFFIWALTRRTSE